MARENAIILGRLIGTYAEWDSVDDLAIALYEFRPAPQLNGMLHACSVLFIDYGNGLITQKSELEPERTCDLLDLLKDFPREKPL